MYAFVDTCDHITDSTDLLPAEAVQVNGQWLDQIVPGFRTLNVSGRELPDSEIDDYTIGNMDGAQFRNQRYTQRTIRITYQLIAKSNLEFREAYNTLCQMLDTEESMLIFNDEPDKYYVGTYGGHGDVPPGVNQVVGEIDFYCSDPFKYAVTETTFQAAKNADGILEATIVNNGTESVPISYEITHNHENGYIGIVSEHGVQQYGFVNESEGENYKQNEMLVTHDDFFQAPDDHSGLDGMHPTYGSSGTLTKKTWFNTPFLTMGSEGTKTGTYNGGKRTVRVPADSEGNVGAKNFYSYMHVIMYAGLMGQTGEMSVSFLTEDDDFICGYCWYKNDTSGNTGHFELNVFDPSKSPSDTFRYRTLKTYDFQTNHLQSDNPWYWDWGHVDIRKEGSKLTFYYWGKYPSYIVPEVENMVCTKIQIAIRQRENSNKYLTYLGLNNLSFQKLNVEKWRDVPNRYQAGDILTVDGKAGKFYVNNMPRQGDEIKGTKYFKAPPGETKVQFYYSDFCNPAPAVTARIREAYL